MSEERPGGELNTPATGVPEAESESLWRELILFLKEEKKWWLVPIVVSVVLIGGLLVVTNSSALAPFLYPFF